MDKVFEDKASIHVMDTDTLRRALEEAGLTEYQVATYLAVLELGSAPAVKVAERSSVPTAQIYDSVRSLESEGYVETIERDKLYVRARRPQAIQDYLKDKSDLFAAAAEEIETRWEEPDAEEYLVNVLKRPESVINRAISAIETADVSVEIAGRMEHYEALSQVVREATDRGIITRMAISGDKEELLNLDPAALQIRWRELPTPFLTIVDRRKAFFAPAQHHGEPYGVVINDDSLSLIMHWYHLTSMWLPCQVVHRARDQPPTYISIEEFIQDVSELWHNGAEFTVTIYGTRDGESELTEVTGFLRDIRVGTGGQAPPDPRIEDLSGVCAIEIENDEGRISVGGWGAFIEDVEAHVIKVLDISLPLQSELHK